MKNSVILFTIVVVVVNLAQLCAGSNSTETTKLATNDTAYIDKYLPEMWLALKKASGNEHLLSINKLKKPSEEFYEHIKVCIVKYLTSIKPIAFVKISSLSNNTCTYRLLREHVDVLNMASRKGFRCLNLYKIGISNIYVDAPELASDEQVTLNKTFADCLDELVAKANNDLDVLTPNVTECANEINKVTTTNVPNVTENDDSSSEESEENNSGSDVNIENSETDINSTTSESTTIQEEEGEKRT